MEAADRYLEPVADGLTTRPSGEWVHGKLFFVKRYIDMFTTSMVGKPWRSVRFIDLFAGPGKCTVRETNEVVLGSPLLALTARKSFTECIFVDNDPEYITTLAERCSLAGKSTQLKYNVADANEIAPIIVEEIQKEDSVWDPKLWKSINLAFLDPEGMELEWTTVEALAGVGRMDLIIHYSQHGLTRNLNNLQMTENENAIDRFFGDREWRAIYDQEKQKGRFSGQAHAALIDHYMSKLQPFGYNVENIDPGVLIRLGKSNAPGYRLLFASKHELATKFWNEVTKKNFQGQMRLL